MAQTHTENALYSPYGAYELKAKYQRNFLIGTLITTSVVVLILAVFWVIAVMGEEEVIDAPVHIIKTIADLGPPPTIAKKPPQVKVNQPDVAAPKIGIPKPVADDEVLDDDVVLATRDELAEIVAPDITAASEGEGIVVDILEEDYLPAIDEFTPVEIPAEMIYKEAADYPRLAQQAGLEGVVWVKALVLKDGTVKQAVVYKSSGTPSLDEAAVKAAYNYRYKPAIQNGRPVAMWVAYKVDFQLPD
jgi:protein TonB